MTTPTSLVLASGFGGRLSNVLYPVSERNRSFHGRSNWYKGVQLILVYAMIAILFYFLPAASR
jgi:hypothetical protein